MTIAERAAAQLIESQREHKALSAPITDTAPELTEPLAYDAQNLVVRARVLNGATLLGAKLGLTSQAKQAQMNVDQPIYGWLTSDMLLASDETVALDRFIHPRAEPEIAFRLGKTIAAPASVASVLESTEAILGAIEIIDSRYDGFRFRLPDVVADNASSAAFRLGNKAVAPDDLEDLRQLGCVLTVDGSIVATATGAAVLGHPAAAVAWLVNRLALKGEQLRAGAIVLSGALTDAVRLSEGTRVSAQFDGLGLVEVQA